MDTRTVARLAEIMGQNNLSELDIEEQGLRIRLTRQAGGYSVAPQVPAPVEEQPVEAPAPAAPEITKEEGQSVTVTSPLVGVFYVSASPEAEPLVHEGSVVKAGQTLCIIEAMKVMNEVKAEHNGVITKVMLPNKTAVEYGTVLFTMNLE